MKSFHCPIEPLEDRVAPAGIIDITTSNGNAVIKVLGNTDTAQDLTIEGSLNGDLLVTGNDGETFRLNGVPGSGPIALNDIVGSLFIDLGKNDDTILLTGVLLGGALTLKMGDGTNSASIVGSTFGAVKYIGGSGPDDLQVSGDNFDVAGKVILKLGAGNNSVELNAALTRIGSDLTYAGGAQLDTLTSQTSLTAIGGNLIFQGAAGASNLNFTSDSLVIGKNFAFVAGQNLTQDSGGAFLLGADLLRVGGKFTYVNPAGKQMISVASNTAVQIAGAVKLVAGPTEDMTANFSAGEIFSAANLAFTGKTTHLTTSISAPVVAIGGPVVGKSLRGFALTGAGVISGPLNVTAGAGGILISAPADDLLVTGKAALKTAALPGQNTSMILNRVQFLSTFTGTLGAGVDTFIGDNLTVFGAFTLNAGSSGDSVFIETNDVAGHSTFFGSVALNLGPGFDALTVGDDDPDKRVYAYRAFKVTGGITSNQTEAISLLNGNVFLVPPVIS